MKEITETEKNTSYSSPFGGSHREGTKSGKGAITIIGGGVIGLFCAYYLKKEGYSIRIIDQGDITKGCSFGNMGYISPSHFIPLASPGIITRGLRWMLSSSSPFYIRPRADWNLMKWGMAFWKNANSKKVEENAPHLYRLLQLSRELMSDLKNEFHDPAGMIEKGIWMLYKSEKTGDHEKQLAEQARNFGLKTVICSAAQVQSFEPEVEVKVAGGVLYQDDCHLNPSRLMEFMYTYLKKEGVEFCLNTEVKGFETRSNRITGIITGKNKMDCSELIVANGSRMPETANQLGIKMLMQPGKGYSIDYTDLPNNLNHPAILVDDRVAATPIGRWLRIGGTMELSGHNDIVLPKRVLAIYQAFRKYFPSLEISPPDAAKAWFGYRPVTPDGMPYIGRHSRFENLSFSGGHAMIGVSAAAATGKLMMEIISHKSTSIETSAFAPNRFF